MDNVKISRIVKQIRKSAPAVRVLSDIAGGQSRVFYGVATAPFGWALIERQGLAVRVEGTDRAELTDTGRDVLRFMAAQNPEGAAL